MTRLLLLLPTLVAPALFAAVESKSVDAIRALDREWATATINKDFGALERLLHNDLTFTHSSARTDSKADLIASLKAGTVVYRSIEFDEIDVRVYGDTAISTSNPLMKIIINGTENNMKLHVVHVWIKTKGQWQMVARQATRVAP